RAQHLPVHARSPADHREHASHDGTDRHQPFGHRLRRRAHTLLMQKEDSMLERCVILLWGACFLGACGGGGDKDSSPNNGNTPPVPVSDCSSLPAAGTFEEITPPEVKAGIGQKTPDNQTNGGPFAMAVDPVNLGTVYSGTLFQGMWKTTDCGARWTKLADGM